MAVFANLYDDFTGGTLSSLWSSFATGSATLTLTSGVIQATPPNATGGSNYAGVDSATSYSLIGNYAVLKVIQMVSTSTHAQCYLKLTADASNNIQIIQENGTIKATKTVGGSTTDVAAGVTYSSTTHLWWRIRESGGTTYFDFAPDGVSWVNSWSLANPITLTALTAEFAAGSYQSETSPGSAQFDRFNILPSGDIFYRHVQVGNGMSRSEVAS